MVTVKPFRPLRPKPEFASRVAAPPYDVVSLEEARKVAEGNPHCFLRVGRAELELADDVDPYSDEVYRHGAANLQGFIESGVMLQERQSIFGVYRQRWGNHEQTGLVALASVEDYDRGIIKKHELTRPVKENDRVRIIETHDSQSGPVLLFFRRTPTFQSWLNDVTGTTPDSQFTAEDGVEHTVWSLRDQGAIQKIVKDFQDVESLYIADGHHRSAAASRVRAVRAKSGSSSSTHSEEGFLSVIFPHDELQILPYNRVVRDLNGHSTQQFMAALGTHYDLKATSSPGKPPEAGFDVYVDGQWHRATPKLTLEQRAQMTKNPVSALAVSVLTERVLNPILGIQDQRSDSRIDFVGGVRPPKELAAKVDGGEWAVAFWLYPTTVEELIAVSDADRIMPPKSTWFEPKLRDGLFVHMLGEK
ncbi:DUF1015 domain-containing protein [Candidatus Nitronereus thalassa]|uniref:DUF1015 family protein n=1 Tax=Candidatus Nitronereus thalassa TaxID=3020898 RepID=A0ABU3K3M0_9BACT|nr:DUF1015 family protein [Candidatus Nitronereus thalassa]MDT7040970.1 DUF1015 family protein [Candidatus Nitronereus thalassa]